MTLDRKLLALLAVAWVGLSIGVLVLNDKLTTLEVEAQDDRRVLGALACQQHTQTTANLALQLYITERVQVSPRCQRFVQQLDLGDFDYEDQGVVRRVR